MRCAKSDQTKTNHEPQFKSQYDAANFLGAGATFDLTLFDN
jgi:hypothetical protein